MRAEALQAPQAVAQALAQDQDLFDALAARLRQHPPQGVVTLARGSSDHAAHHFAYLAMARLGQLVTSLPLSLLTLQPHRLPAPGLLALAFSQSGQSPDLVGALQTLRDGGACTVACVNDTASPLAQAGQWRLPLRAGPETSVAATKSCIAQLVAGVRLLAAWQPCADLQAALQALPARLEEAAASDWGAALPLLAGVDRMFVVSRGAGLAVALEAALKFKETCGIQAEAFSGAELRHGPMALVGAGYPVLVLAPRGPAQAGLLALAAELQARGAVVLLAAPAGTPGIAAAVRTWLPLPVTDDEALDTIAALQAFYPMVEALARARGRDPDRPAFLSKVTLTR